MTDRVKKRLEAMRAVKKFIVCTEAADIEIDSYLRHDGDPHIIRRAYAAAEYLDKRTIFINDGELLVGNFASKFMGMEANFRGPSWDPDDLKDMLQNNDMIIPEDAAETLGKVNDYWRDRGRTAAERRSRYYTDERIWPFIRQGILCPAWKSKKEGRGYGGAGAPWGNNSGLGLYVPLYGEIIATGMEAKIAEVKEAMANLRFLSSDDMEAYDYYEAAVIHMEALCRTGDRFSKLAAEMAEKETDPKRKAELEQISEICARVPRKPARNFREAMQFFLFYYFAICNPTLPGGRIDQYMYPYYKKDLEEGKITREEAVELCELLRIKIMEYNAVGGGKAQREKWAGMARWQNFMIGGVDRDGNEVSNEFSFIWLDAAEEIRTPHPTITLRVSDKTPPELLNRAVEVVRSGIGMPAFVSDKSIINFLQSRNVPLADARDYAMAGCLDLQVAGRSHQTSVGMFITPMLLQLAMNNGVNPNNGEDVGPHTGKFTEFKTYEEFYQALMKQFDWAIHLICEEHNIQIDYFRIYEQDALLSIWAYEGVSSGKPILSRRMIYENASLINICAIQNVINSLEAIKKLVFEDRTVSAQELLDAVNNNWEGREDLRQMCLKAPKWGNNIDEVDQIGTRIWHDIAQIAKTTKTIFNESMVPSGISITAYSPAGKAMKATPDGRHDHDILADGTISPTQGTDTSGPLAVLQSGMKINQDEYMSTLLNMKFTRSTLKTDQDVAKLGSMIRTYLLNGGKHVQFNVVDKETLLDAQIHKEQHRDLIVRVAGYSAYFTMLTPGVQQDVISRTGHEL